MKKLIIASLFVLFIFVPVSHAILQELKIDISLNEDKTSDWTVTYLYSEPVKKSDFFILAGVNAYNVTADDMTVECSISRSVGTSIICNNINAKKVVYSLRTFQLVSSIQSLDVFSHRFSITEATDKVLVSIRLPFGTAFADPSKLEGTGLNQFEPSNGRQGSDGRRIFVEWNFEKPHLGATIDFKVVYEPVKPIDFNVFLGIMSAIVIAFLAFLVFFFKRSRVEEILPVLTESERKIMEIILREKQVDQRVIVKETDFSKAKASRIIQDLEKRGLIEKRPKGRTNIISLKKRAI